MTKVAPWIAWIAPAIVVTLLLQVTVRYRRALRVSGLLALLSIGAALMPLSAAVSHFAAHAASALGGAPRQIPEAPLEGVGRLAWILGPGALIALLMEKKNASTVEPARARRVHALAICVIPLVAFLSPRATRAIDARYSLEWRDAYEGESRLQYRAEPSPRRLAAMGDLRAARILLENPGKGQPFGFQAVRGYALDRVGQLFTWDPQRPERAPVRWPALGTIGAIARWGAHLCVIDEHDVLSCWSPGDPAHVSTIPGVAQMESSGLEGERLCALSRSGRLTCWREPSSPGDMFARLSEDAWIAGMEAEAFTARFGGAGCVARQGAVECAWKDAAGALMHAAVPGVYDVDRMVSSDRRACAVRRDGQLFCWSPGERRALVVDTYLPGSRVKQVSMSAAHACAITETGTVHCWGDNAWGQIGDGTVNARDLPVLVKGIGRAAAVSARAASTCALVEDGTISCWGKRGREWW